MTFRYVNKIKLGMSFICRIEDIDPSTKFDLEMTFRYVNKIQLGYDFQIRLAKFDFEISFRYENKIRLGDDFQIRKQNSTWRCLLDP